MPDEQFEITWVDGRREPVCDPDPAYQYGVDLVIGAPEKPRCTVLLAYPARRCGFYRIECRRCSVVIACTTAGRVDDPKSVSFNCHMHGAQAPVLRIPAASDVKH
jgi:hypothetical protein